MECFSKLCHFGPHLATPLSLRGTVYPPPNTPKQHHFGHVVQHTWTTGGPRLDHGSIPMRNWDRGPIPGDPIYYYIKDREPDHEPKTSRILQGGRGMRPCVAARCSFWKNFPSGAVACHSAVPCAMAAMNDCIPSLTVAKGSCLHFENTNDN